jgi:hypothetical protein
MTETTELLLDLAFDSCVCLLILMYARNFMIDVAQCLLFGRMV